MEEAKELPQPASILDRRTALQRSIDSFVQEFTYDSLIKREWFERAWDIVYPKSCSKQETHAIDGRFNSTMGEFRRTLLHEHKMALESLKNGTWHILTQEQHIDFFLDFARDGISRVVSFSLDGLRHAPTDA